MKADRKEVMLPGEIVLGVQSQRHEFLHMAATQIREGKTTLDAAQTAALVDLLAEYVKGAREDQTKLEATGEREHDLRESLATARDAIRAALATLPKE